MHLEESAPVRRIGIVTGYILSYLLFTTALFMLFAVLNKRHWQYYEVVALTASISALGMAVRRLLK